METIDVNTEKPNVCWHIELTGNRFDLEDLSVWFSDPELCVKELKGRYYLISSKFNDFNDNTDAIWAHAQVLLERMHGAAKLYRTDFQPIGLEAMIGEIRGRQHHIVHVVESIVLSFKPMPPTIMIGGKEVPQTYPLADWVVLARNDETVARVLRLWGNGSLDWVNLYRVFEVVESDAGGRICREGWIAESDKTRFTRTANSMKAIGDAARHAKPNFEPPSRPLALEEARDIITRLVRAWLANKSL